MFPVIQVMTSVVLLEQYSWWNRLYCCNRYGREL